MDSDTDDNFSNNMFSFQNQNTCFIKGPKINTNLTPFNFGNNSTSSMNMVSNFNRPRYAESVCDQPSMHRREVSPPISLRSASGFQPRNFRHPYYHGAMSSQRSLYNGRRGSPMSVRTMDSNTSVSALDIVAAFKTVHFNKYDLRKIKDAYDQFLKRRIRKRYEKRRKLMRTRQHLGGESGEEGSNSSISGDECRSTKSFRTIRSGRERVEGSNSSISGDDCRSTNSFRTIHAGKGYSQSSRSTRADLSDLRQTMQDNNLYKDSTTNFQKSSYRNMLSVPPRHAQDSYCRSNLTVQNNSVMEQKDTFQNRFLLPSQRFNQSTVSVSIPPKMPRNNVNGRLNMTNWSVQNQKIPLSNRCETDSEQEQIFSDRTVVETSSKNTRGSRSKRRLDDDTIKGPEKRIKLLSPQRLNEKSKAPIPKKTTSKGTTNDFVFAKPQFPIKKIGNVKNSQDKVIVKPAQTTDKLTLSSCQTTAETVPERIVTDKTIFKPQEPVAIDEKSKATKISEKSKIRENITVISKQQPQKQKKNLDSGSQQQEQFILEPQPSEILISKSSHPLDRQAQPEVQKITEVNEQAMGRHECDQSKTQHSTANVSMRPSFIKRKLFTQKVIEDGNMSCSSDNADTNSPVTNIYSDIQKEKNKTRRLVTSQSCLSRDIGDDSNFLDLIHKVVPPERINITTMNQTIGVKTIQTNSDKFDVYDALAKCSTEDLSDTYTDEEIFNEAEITKVETNKNKFGEENAKNGLNAKKNSNVKNETLKKCNILVHKLVPQNGKRLLKEVKNDRTPTVAQTCLKRSVYQCVRSFWDTDLESDLENQGTPSRELKGTPSRESKESHAKVTSKVKDRAKDQDLKKQRTESVAPVLEESTAVNQTRTTVNKTTLTIDENHNSSKRTRKPIKPVDENKNIKTKQTQPKTSKSDKALEPMQNKKITSNKTIDTIPDKSYAVITSNLRIRQPRTPKIKLCCEPSKQCLKNTSETLYKSLRPRKVTPKIKLCSEPLTSKQSLNNTSETLCKSLRPRKVTPKIKLCGEPLISERSLNNTSETLCKSLRSREVDISPSANSDKSTKKRVTKNEEVAKNNFFTKMHNSMDNSGSDFSFTLPTEKTKMRTRQSNNSSSCNTSNISTTRRTRRTRN